jgi:hypothetical protein
MVFNATFNNISWSSVFLKSYTIKLLICNFNNFSNTISKYYLYFYLKSAICFNITVKKNDSKWWSVHQVNQINQSYNMAKKENIIKSDRTRHSN